LDKFYKKEGRVGVIRLNRPFDDLDALVECVGILSDIRQEVTWDEEVRCVVVTGAGAFGPGPDAAVSCAGLFDSGLAEPETPAAVLGKFSKPVIGAIEGNAQGPGLELALACDLRFCSEGSRFSMNHLACGGFPADGGLQRMARLLGRGRALCLALLAEEIDGTEAHRLGLVHRVVRGESVLGAAMATAAGIAAMAPYAVRYVKEAVLRGVELPLEQALRLEADLYIHLHSTSDRVEGITAFREKRPPKFEGR
jgi:enoyl-CoA hydratase/carnithine racemase